MVPNLGLAWPVTASFRGGSAFFNAEPGPVAALAWPGSAARVVEAVRGRFGGGGGCEPILEPSVSFAREGCCEVVVVVVEGAEVGGDGW